MAISPALSYLSGRDIDIAPDAHVVISVVRNEILRLPYFLAYYRGLGFDHFILIDNGSDDATRQYLLDQPDVFLFSTPESFAASGFGMAWVNLLLNHYCDGRWILLADADEILVWPNSERQSIGDLTARLHAGGAGGLFTLLLDMYSQNPFGRVGYVPGEKFVARCPFFDAGPYELVPAGLFPYRQIYGGVRSRVFKNTAGRQFHPPTASKVPLLRWHRGQGFQLVAHGLAAPVSLAPMRGALLHFKMFDDLPEKCRVEVARGQHFDNAREYGALAQAIDQSPSGSFLDPRFSVRYSGTSQLVSLGLMSDREPFGA